MFWLNASSKTKLLSESAKVRTESTYKETIVYKNQHRTICKQIACNQRIEISASVITFHPDV
jgi:hypothetical protein